MLCVKCKKDKPKEDFYRRKKGERKGEYYSRCKDCFKKRGRKYYHENKERQLPLAKKRTKKARDLKRKYLYKIKDVPCADCGVEYPHYVMDFDHKEGNDKIIAVAQAVNKNWSLERIKKEIEKCDIVCANCHRIRTYGNKPR